MKLGDMIQLLICTALAIFGASARALRYSDVNKLQMLRLISNMFVASFGATIVYFITTMSNLPAQMGFIMSGLIGWGGPQIIDKIFEKNTDLSADIELDKEGGEK